MTRTERSWILYDVANSAFVLIAITAVGPIFFKDVVSHGVDSSLSTSNWGYANSLASLLLALMAPIMGALADYRGLKKRFFIVFLCVGIGFTFLLAMVIFVVISVGIWYLPDALNKFLDIMKCYFNFF